MRLKPLPILYHLIPLVPLVMGRPYATIAALILVAVPYLKVQKLKAQLLLLQQNDLGRSRTQGLAAQGLAKEKAALQRTIRLWEAVTFFKVSALADDESQQQTPDKPR